MKSALWRKRQFKHVVKHIDDDNDDEFQMLKIKGQSHEVRSVFLSCPAKNGKYKYSQRALCIGLQINERNLKLQKKTYILS